MVIFIFLLIFRVEINNFSASYSLPHGSSSPHSTMSSQWSPLPSLIPLIVLQSLSSLLTPCFEKATALQDGAIIGGNLSPTVACLLITSTCLPMVVPLVSPCYDTLLCASSFYLFEKIVYSQSWTTLLWTPRHMSANHHAPIRLVQCIRPNSPTETWVLIQQFSKNVNICLASTRGSSEEGNVAGDKEGSRNNSTKEIKNKDSVQSSLSSNIDVHPRVFKHML